MSRNNSTMFGSSEGDGRWGREGEKQGKEEEREGGREGRRDGGRGRVF
jgi:hypothetical protein